MLLEANITPKTKVLATVSKEEKEPSAVLILAPFQPHVWMKLESNNNNSVSSNLTLKNTSNQSLNVKISKLPPKERSIVLDTSDILIGPESEVNLLVSWMPTSPGSWRDTLQFTDSRRIKYDVSITRVCTSSGKQTKNGNKGTTTFLTQHSSYEARKNNNRHRIYETDHSSIKINNKKDHSNGNGIAKQIQIDEDKENTVRNRNYKNQNRLQTPVKNNQNVSKYNDVPSTASENAALNALNISDFLLTPIHSSAPKSKPVLLEKPMDLKLGLSHPSIPIINVINATRNDISFHNSRIFENNVNYQNIRRETYSATDSKIPKSILRSSTTISDIKVINAKHEKFSLQNANIPGNKQDFNIRETYTTAEPKFHKKVQFVLKEGEEEKYDDSLSPSDTQKEVHNFASIINNMNFLTPINWSLPSACSTTNRRLSINPRLLDTEFSLPDHNDTFNISSSSGIKANSTYELLPTPSPGTDKQLHSARLSNMFERKHLLTDELEIKARSLSPVPLDQTRSSLSHSTLRYRDNASVKEVLEAKLWAKDSQETSHLLTFEDRCASLDMIVEENLDISCRPHVKSSAKNNSEVRVSKELVQLQISPPKKLLQPVAVKRISPIKHNKVNKEKCASQNNTLNKKTVPLASSLKKRNNPSISTIPRVKVAKLSLSGLKNKSISKPCPKKQPITKLHNPNDLISEICNADIFGATMTDNPFISHTHFFDDKFILNQGIEFMKWLNALLTPPEHLDVDIDSAHIDLGKIWQSCRTKEITLAESKEAVSARYHMDTRLNTLRKAGCALFNRDEVKKVLADATSCILGNKSILIIRQDRDLHRDIGLQKEIMGLFVSYNPLWLRIGLEVVYGETIPLISNHDYSGLTRFLVGRFFSDPFLVRKHPVQNIPSLKRQEFQGLLNKFILTKFLCIVYFLDYAKRNKLIGHDPCLFRKQAPFKASREILLTFSRLVLSGIGDITKVLRMQNYIVSHKQTYLDEYKYAVKDLCTDLRDGVRLCRVMELITGDKTLTSRCRLPAISRLQKVHNVDVALTALYTAGYNITGDINAKSIVDGHREKTLSLLWQLIYRVQASRFEKAAVTIQKWWRAALWYVKVKNYLADRKRNAAEFIQRAWRCAQARQTLKVLRQERKLYMKKLEKTAITIQLQWNKQKKMLAARHQYLKMRTSAIIIQRWFRRVKASRPYLQEFQRKHEAAIVIQTRWRASVQMRRERDNYRRIRQTVITIQQRWSAIILRRSAESNYHKLKSATLCIQRKWKANRLMRQQCHDYLEKVEATLVIQLWWRNSMLTKQVRNDYLLNKNAVRTIEGFWEAQRLGAIERKRFLNIKASAIVIQRTWIKFRGTKNYIQRFKSHQNAVRSLQRWWRMITVSREYKKKKKSAIIIQKLWRSSIIAKHIKSEYVSLKTSAIVVQKTWKMKQQRRKYLQMKTAVCKIEIWCTTWRQTRAARCNFVGMKSATVLIQGWWRNLMLSQQYRSDYSKIRTAAMLIQATKENYLKKRSAVIKIQAHWRRVCARIAYLKLLRRQNAALVLQRRWRTRAFGLKLRAEYIKQKSAVVCIQQRYRAMKLTKLERVQYLSYRNAAMIIQKNWRMHSAVQNYRRFQTAVVTLQFQWRARQLTIRKRKNYVEFRDNVIIIQRLYRAKYVGKKIRVEYLQLYQATVTVQRAWKAQRLIIKARKQYLSQRKAAVIIQSYYRMTIYQRKYLKIKRAVSTIQEAWKSCFIARKVRCDYLKLNNAAIFAQRRFRAIKFAKRTRNKFKKLKKTVIFVQRAWRLKLELRKLAAELEAQRIYVNAVIKIQALWRGYDLRKKQSAQVAELRERSNRAAAAATPSETVEYRLHSVLYDLQSFNSVGQFSMCFACIDTMTRLSVKGCILLCELNLVQRIYMILEDSIRSLPWKEVWLRCTNILITLIKLPQTSSYVKRIEGTETIARLMTATVKHDINIFLHLATLFWLYLLDDEFCSKIRKTKGPVFLIRSLYIPSVLKSTAHLKGTKKQSMPNPKPDWGLKTKKPRCFGAVSTAMMSIKDLMN